MRILLIVIASLVASEGGRECFAQSSWPVAPQRQKMPTGVVPGRIPIGTPFQTHGPKAQQFVADALGYGDDDISDSEEPWLVLFGPVDATKQIEDGIPADIVPKVQVAAYDPETEAGKLKLKELGVSVGGRGVKALVMDAGGNVVFEGLFSKEEVVKKLRELLGLSPPDDEPDDNDGWPLPSPFRKVPFWMMTQFWVGVVVGFILARVVVPLFQMASSLGAMISEFRSVAEELRKRRESPK